MLDVKRVLPYTNAVKLIQRSSIPILMNALMLQLFSVQQFWFVSWCVGLGAAASFSIASIYIFTVVSTFTAKSRGATEMAEQAYKEGRMDDFRNIINTLIIHSIFLGIVAMFATMVVAPFYCSWINTPDEIYDQTVKFLKVFAHLFPLIFTYNSSALILGIFGDYSLSTIVQTVSFLLSGMANYVLLVILDMSMNSVAYSAFLSQFVCVILCLYFVDHKDEGIKLGWKNRSFDPSLIMKFFHNGRNAILLACGAALSRSVAQYYINACGIKIIVAFAIYFLIEETIFLPISSTKGPIAHFSAEQVDDPSNNNLVRTINVLILGATLFTIITSIIFTQFSDLCMIAFTSDSEVIKCGVQIFKVIVPYLVGKTLVNVLSSSLEGLGRKKEVMAINLGILRLFRIIIVIVICSIVVDHIAIAITIPLSWALAAVVLTLYYYLYYSNRGNNSIN